MEDINEFLQRIGSDYPDLVNPSANINEDTYSNLEQTIDTDPYYYNLGNIGAGTKYGTNYSRPTDIVTKIFNGFIEGLTTIPVGEAPKNEAEQIGMSIGHLMGFIGYFPGPGLLGKIGVSSVGKAIGLGRLGKYAGKTTNLLGGYSVPMILSKAIMKGMEKYSRAPLTMVKGYLSKGALQFMEKEGVKAVGSAVRTGTELAIAGGISKNPLFNPLDETLENMAWMGAFGAGSGYLGSLINPKGALSLGRRFYPEVSEMTSTNLANPVFIKTLNKAKTIDNVVRALATAGSQGVLVDGVMDADRPTYTKLYDYLLNAYFGYKEAPWFVRKASKISEELSKSPSGRLNLLDPEKTYEGWDKLEKPVQDELMLQSFTEFGRVLSVLNKEGKAANLTSTELATISSLKEAIDKAGLKDLPEYDVITKIIKDEDNITDKELDDVRIGVAEVLKNKVSQAEIFKDFINLPSDIPTEIGKGTTAETLDAQNLMDRRTFWMTDQIQGLSKNLAKKIGTPAEEGTNKLNKLIIESILPQLGRKDINSDKAFDEFITSFKDSIIREYKVTDFNIENTDPIYRDIKNRFRIVSQFSEVPVYYISTKNFEDGARNPIVPYPTHIRNIPVNKQFGAEWLYNKLSGNTAKVIKVSKEIKNSYNIYEENNPEAMIRLQKMLYDNGEILDYGKKADDTLFSRKPFFGKFENGKYIFSEDELSVINTAWEGVKSLYDNKLPAEFIAREKENPQFLKHMIAENAEFLRKFNGFDTITELFEKIKDKNYQILFGPNEINLRMQLFADMSNTFSPDKADIESKIPDIKGGFKNVILNTDNKGIYKQIKQFINYQRLKYKTDKGYEAMAKAVIDGGQWIRADLFDYIAEHYGLEKGIGFLKMVNIHEGGPDKLGGYLGKLGSHKASPAMSEYMKRKGIHAIDFDSTAKQRGGRKALDWYFDGKEMVIEGLEGEVNREPIDPIWFEEPKEIKIEKKYEDKIIEGDIFLKEGIPIIPTNLGGIHGAGLAEQAYKRKYITYKKDGNFGDRNGVITFPVKKVWSDKADINLIKNSATKLINLANANPNKKYTLPLIGIGHGEGKIEEIIPIIKTILDKTSNIKLILPTNTINLGRKGTLRKDNTLSLLPKIRELLLNSEQNVPEPEIVQPGQPGEVLEGFKPISDINKIYTELGNKTQSENVVFKPWNELKDVKKAIIDNISIVSTRIFNSNKHFGNPFSSDKEVIKKNPALIRVSNTQEAVENYINWILGGAIPDSNVIVETNGIKDYEKILPERREWIRKKLQSGELKGKPILYYKELGEPSHATALDYLINKYNWNNQNISKEINKPIEPIESKPISEYIYSHPVESIKFNFAENKEQAFGKGKYTLAKQLGSNIYDSEVAKDYRDYYFKPVFEGTDLGKKFISELKNIDFNNMSEEHKKIWDNLDIEDLPIKFRLDTILSLNKTPLWDKLVKDMLSSQGEDMYEDIWEQKRYSEKLLASRGGGWAIINSGAEITPALIRNNKDLKSYFLSILKHYVVNSVVNPKVKNSAKAVIKPLEPYNDARLGTLNDEEIFLDSGFREMKIDHEGKKISLGELFDKGLLKDKEIIIVRIPQDGRSGAKVVKIKGFTDVDGYGITMNDKNMMDLGGADTDADTTFIYFDTPQKTREYYKKYKDHGSWTKKNGELYFRDSGNFNPFYNFEGRKRLPFLPESYLISNLYAATGNQGLGPTLSMFNRVMEALPEKDTTIKISMDEGDVKGGFLVKIKGKSSIMSFLEDAKRDGVNKHADSAKGFPIKNSLEIYNNIKDMVIEKITPYGYIDNIRKDIETLKSIKNRTSKQTEKLDKLEKVYRGFINKNTQLKGLLPKYKASKELDKLYDNSVNPEYRDFIKFTSELNEEYINPYYANLQQLRKQINTVIEFAPGEGTGQYINKFGDAFSKYINSEGGEDKVLASSGKKEFNINFASIEKALVTYRKDLENEIMPLEQINQLVKEYHADLISRHLFTISNLVNTHRFAMEAKKIAGFNRNSILREVNNIKNMLAKSSYDDTITIDDVMKKVVDFRATLGMDKASNNPVKLYFDALLISSINPDAVAFRRSDVKEFVTKEVNDKWSKIAGTGGPERDRKITAEINKKVNAIVKKMGMHNEKAGKAFYTITDPIVLKNQVKVFNDIVEMTYTKPIEPIGKEEILPLESFGEGTKSQEYIEKNFGIKNAPITIINKEKSANSILRKVNLFDIDKGTIDADLLPYRDRLADFLVKNPGLLKHFEDYFINFMYERYNKPMNFQYATKRDFKDFVDTIEQITKSKPGDFKIKRWHYFILPSALDRKWREYDKNTIDRNIKLWEVNGGKPAVVDAVIKQNMSYMERLHRVGLMGNEFYDRTSIKLKNNFASSYLMKLTDKLGNDGDIVWKYIISEKEKDNPIDENTIINKKYINYRNAYEMALKDYETLKGKTYKAVDRNGKEIYMTIEEIADTFRKELPQVNKWFWENIIYNPKEMAKLEKEFVDKDTGLVNYVKALSNDAAKLIAGNPGDIPFRSLYVLQRIRHSMILDKVQFFDPAYNVVVETENGPVIKKGNFRSGSEINDEVEKKSFYLRLKKMTVVDEEGNEVPKYPMLNYNMENIGQIDFNKYFPHIGGSVAETEAQAKEIENTMKVNYDKEIELAKTDEDRQKITEAYNKDLLKLKLSMEQNIGEQEYGNVNLDLFNSLENSTMTVERAENSKLFSQASNLKHRSTNIPILGYTRHPIAYIKYGESILKEYWNEVTAMTGHTIVDRFLKNPNIDMAPEVKRSWGRFMKLYIRNATGAPDTIPEEYINDPYMALSKNYYKLMTNNPYIKLYKKIFNKSLEEDTKNIANKDIKEDVKNELAALRTSKRISWLSNLDGKWQMMSLLTSPKTFVQNIFSADVNTIINVGYTNFSKARNLEYLKSINPEWKSWGDIERSIDELGGIESFINEIQTKSVTADFKTKMFWQRVSSALKKDSNLEDKRIFEIAREEGLTDKWAEINSWFMRKSERIARRRSWLAHYLNAREAFDINNDIIEWNDPWLVDKANRGVAATQFLYNNASKPMFMATSLGKIMYRFQTWTMNSIEFRNEIRRRAIEHGQANKELQDRLGRLVIADATIMALGSMLPSSFFSYSLPAPLSWFRDLSNYLFGTEKQQEMAFFGAMPHPFNIAQPLLPPAARLPEGIFVSLFTGEFQRYAGYSMMSMFPFHRTIRDTYKSYKNLALTPENMFGFPLITAFGASTKAKKREQITTRSLSQPEPIEEIPDYYGIEQ